MNASVRAGIAAAAGGLALLFASAFATAQAGAGASGAMDALVKAAKAEGSVTWYMSFDAAIAQRVNEAFRAKYGINASNLRLSSPALLQRYSAEADAGKIVAGMLVLTINTTQLEPLLKKDWVEPAADSDLPVLKGEYPAEFNSGPTRMVAAAPWQLGYNTQRVTKDQLPKDWKDLLDPRWKGRIIIPDPASSESYVPFWDTVMQHYGEGYLKALRAQELRVAASGVPAVQALGAGEGDVAFPVLAGNVVPVKTAGAPLEIVGLTGASTGNFTQIILTRRSKSPQPNASRLLANYLLSKEGNAVYNADPGLVGPYNIKELPPGFQAASPDALQRKGKIINLLTGK